MFGIDAFGRHPGGKAGRSQVGSWFHTSGHEAKPRRGPIANVDFVGTHFVAARTCAGGSASDPEHVAIPVFEVVSREPVIHSVDFFRQDFDLSQVRGAQEASIMARSAFLFPCVVWRHPKIIRSLVTRTPL